MNAKQIKILVVDDNPDTLEMLQRKLKSRDYVSYTAPDVDSAIKLLAHTAIDIILTDFKMPKFTGLDLIRHVQAQYPLIRVIMITGYPTIEGAVEAVKVGAQGYLSKPFTDEELFKAINEARQTQERTPQHLDNKPQYGLVGNSKAIQKVCDSIKKSTTNLATVLIQGESGTGKELVARAIHYHSKQSKAPFVPVNCGAIPETLLEAELFGYMKGSFTGASETRAGYFITADGGTIFLDEISETSLMMQVKLLRVLQDKQVTMIGSSKPRKVNVRIIAATNKDLSLCVKQGSFREDLFYRLNVLQINIPPLREHSEDIPLLVSHFLEKYSRELGLGVPRLSDSVMHRLMHYPWQGNIRELENLIYRLVVMNDGGQVRESDLPDYMRYCIMPNTDLERTLAQVEADYIKDVLNLVNGNKSLAAKKLGIDRKTLYAKLSAIQADSMDHDN